MSDSSRAYNMLSPGMRKWVGAQGWPGFRDVQAEAIETLLGTDDPPSIVVSAPTAAGKALADYVPVLTNKGWKPIGKLDRFDKVYSSDGKIHDVLGVFPQGDKEVLRMMLADGRSIDCSEDHIWRVIDRKAQADGESNFLLDKTTSEILTALQDNVDGRILDSEAKSAIFAIPNCAPITLSAEDEDVALPFDPYTMGASIGNASCAYQDKCDSITNSVPESLMSASTVQRRNFLTGLFETSGTTVLGGVKFLMPTMQLAQDVLYLARSLGYAATMSDAHDACNEDVNADHPDNNSERSVFVAANEKLFRHPQKQGQSDQTGDLVSGGLWHDGVEIIGIERTGSYTPMTCIAVDSEDHTYIAEDFTVTHNTEAAFLPALSIIEERYISNPSERFCSMLWVSPLKALLTDSHRRLQEVASHINLPVYLWHGDAPQGQKNEMLREHDGMIMITPESLESFLVNRGQWCANYMTPMVIVVDEFHAFLGEGRGKQMLSLLDRIDMINAQHGRPPAIRIGLSATLSKLDLVASILAPRGKRAVIDGTGAGQDKIDIKVKAFERPIRREGQKNVPKEDLIAIGRDIIDGSLGEKTLTFATSRMQVESIASAINDICKRDGIPSEAFPHHGSLAKEIRQDLEKRLVGTDKPTMAVATITLELGIDIGDIYKVFQVGATNSVASLRQRIGRSGRRDGHKRCECLITAAKTPQDMESDLVNIIAEIELMNAGWFEPPQNKRKDISVMISEILSVVKQYDSAYEEDLYALLVERGAFWNVPRDMFGMVIMDMVEKDFLHKMEDGTLVVGIAGDRELSDYHFYASFMTVEAWSVKSGGKTIGEIMPPDSSLMMLAQGGTFMLGGRYWQVQPPIDMKSRTMNVKQINSKARFLVPTSRGSGDVCGMIKKTAIRLLTGDLSAYVPDYIDESSKELLAEAREYAKTHHLNGLGISIYDGGEGGSETDSEVAERARTGYHDQALLSINPPVDQGAYDAIVKVLQATGMEDPSGLANIPQWRMNELVSAALSNWEDIEANREHLFDRIMIEDLRNCEKYNWVLNDEALRYAYVDERIDLAGAKKWFEAYARFAGVA